MASQNLLTTSVGSFPKPPEVQAARAAFRRGEISEAQLLEKERAATAQVIAMQEELGLDILVHGEMERGDMVAYFAEHWSGFETAQPVRSYGNRYYHKPIVVGKVSDEHVGLPAKAYTEAQALTQKPVKGMLTGPYTMCDWSFNLAYPDRASLVMDLAQIVRAEALALQEAGATIIQIDEPALSTRPEEIGLASRAMEVATQGLTAKTVSHVCYGAFERIFPALLDFPVDQLDLEAANGGFALLDLLAKGRWPEGKELALGVVDVHSHRLESVADVKAGIHKALSLVPPERLVIDPDCGLKTRTWEEARAKLDVVVKATKEVREELGLR